MDRYKITALKNVSVCAQIRFQGSIALPPNHQGQSQGRMPQTKNREETFQMNKGQSRDDVAFIISAEEARSVGYPMPFVHPATVGATSVYYDLLVVEKLE